MSYETVVPIGEGNKFIAVYEQSDDAKAGEWDLKELYHFNEFSIRTDCATMIHMVVSSYAFRDLRSIIGIRIINDWWDRKRKAETFN